MAASGEHSLTLDPMEKFKDLLFWIYCTNGTKLSDNGPWLVPLKLYPTCPHPIQDGRQRGTHFNIGPYGNIFKDLLL